MWDGWTVVSVLNAYQGYIYLIACVMTYKWDKKPSIPPASCFCINWSLISSLYIRPIQIIFVIFHKLCWIKFIIIFSCSKNPQQENIFFLTSAKILRIFTEEFIKKYTFVSGQVTKKLVKKISSIHTHSIIDAFDIFLRFVKITFESFAILINKLKAIFNDL